MANKRYGGVFNHYSPGSGSQLTAGCVLLILCILAGLLLERMSLIVVAFFLLFSCIIPASFEPDCDVDKSAGELDD